LVRATLSLGDELLRAPYVASVARASPLDDFGRALDILCQRAEQADPHAREALVAVVDALNAEDMAPFVKELRELASAESLLALERLIRGPARAAPSSHPTNRPPDVESNTAGIQKKSGRPLTLGERKSLARRPDRETMRKLLADPHPDVIRRCLRNPRMTEDDLIPLASKRPGRSEVLAEIARSRWVHRRRVRLALVLNPATPPEIAVRIAGLLLRPELEMVAESPGVPVALRAICLEHLARRPPMPVPRASAGQGGQGVH
jgi:hypothetical protein